MSSARRKTAEERTVTNVHCANANPMRGETGRQISAWGLTVQCQTHAQTQSGAAAFSSVLSVTNLLCGSTDSAGSAHLNYAAINDQGSAKIFLMLAASQFDRNKI